MKAQKRANGSSQDPPVVTDQPRGHSSNGSRERPAAGGGRYIQRVTNDEREDEMEENLE